MLPVETPAQTPAQTWNECAPQTPRARRPYARAAPRSTPHASRSRRRLQRKVCFVGDRFLSYPFRRVIPCRRIRPRCTPCNVFLMNLAIPRGLSRELWITRCLSTWFSPGGPMVPSSKRWLSPAKSTCWNPVCPQGTSGRVIYPQVSSPLLHRIVVTLAPRDTQPADKPADTTSHNRHIFARYPPVINTKATART